MIGKPDTIALQLHYAKGKRYAVVVDHGRRDRNLGGVHKHLEYAKWEVTQHTKAQVMQITREGALVVPE